MSIKYFAYGSNMLLQRLRAHDRAPSARFVTVAKLTRHRLKFHKRSKDGSGKCNAFQTGDPKDEIYGVVFMIDESEKPALDRAEGLGKGYRQKTVQLISLDRNVLAAYTYIATINYIDDTVRPYTWYKDIVIAGAKQHSLPSAYIRKLGGVVK